MNEQRRPAGEDRTATRDGCSATSIADLESVREHIDGVLVLVVTTDEGQIRRRVYLNTKPAERAARRAEARGHRAEIVLCRLEPVELAGGAR